METTQIPPPSQPPANLPEPAKSFSWRYPIIIGLVLAIVITVVLLRHAKAQGELKNITREMAVSTVVVVHPERESADMSLVLPGNVQALRESPIYARVNGYVTRWLVDIGTAVKAGQLLAEIDTPETDQQHSQARALLRQAEAEMKLAQSTADRWTKLLKENAVSQQQTDEKVSSLEVKKADLAAAQANVNLLEELLIFKKVVAPFDGIITARRTEVGNLINAGAGSASRELFRVAQINSLRIYTNVPEAYSSFVTKGTKARIEMAAAPGITIAGEVVRTSGAIDPVSSTMLVEIDLPNEDGKFLPGGYAKVHLDLVLEHPLLLIPVNTLIFRSHGTQVGVVDTKTNLVRLAPVKIGRDFGSKLEIIHGLNEQDSLILNPSDSLVEGEKVQIETPKPGGKRP